MATAYRIKNWHQFQHFKDRRPPWIKLYRSLLDDPEWGELCGDHAKALVSLWLIASDQKEPGTLPKPSALAYRMRITVAELETIVSGLNHWVEQDDIATISTRHQLDAPETETETETETEGEGEADRPHTPHADAGEGWTLDQCIAAAAAIGMPKPMVEAWWAHYAAVGFIDAAGRKIRNLPAALAKWRAQQADRAARGLSCGAPKSTADMLAESRARLAAGGGA